MNYTMLNAQVKALTEGVPHVISNLANTAAAIWQAMDDINWAGFYLMEQGKLVLGPFQGKAARVLIPVGQGVCGTAVAEDKVQRVANVHNFCGHIACDSASNSEIVIPMHVGGEIWGVLDMDSPVLDRFSEIDQAGLERFVHTLEQVLER